MRDVEVYVAGYIPDADKSAGLIGIFQFYLQKSKSIVLVFDFYVYCFDKYYCASTLYSVQ